VKESYNASKSTFILSSILGMLIVSTLVAISSYFIRPSIELDLKTKLVSKLSKIEVKNSFIQVSGRDITLYGSVPNKIDALTAEDIATNIQGVRQVKNELLIKGEKIE